MCYCAVGTCISVCGVVVVVAEVVVCACVCVITVHCLQSMDCGSSSPSKHVVKPPHYDM